MVWRSPALLPALASVGRPAAVGGDGDGDGNGNGNACVLLDARCPDPVMRDLQGDARAMAARRPWFDAQWAAYAAQTAGRPVTP